MAESDFEAQLDELFAAAPPLADADAFAGRLERQAERVLARRRWVLGGLGSAGGLIAVIALAQSDLAERALAWLTASQGASGPLLGVASFSLLAAAVLILTPTLIRAVQQAD